MPRKAAIPTPTEPVAPDVRLVRLDTLYPDPDNVRVHPEANLRAIRDSLTAFGQQRPLVVMADGLVLAGNGTLEAAKQLGWSHIAVQVCTLPLDQARAYAVADNRTGELSSWNETGLATLLKSLHEQELPLPGWDADELHQLCTGTALPVDYDQEWHGMPAFDAPGEPDYQQIILHFRCAEDVQAFAQLVKQPITDNTKYLYFPAQERHDLAQHVYTA